jgi:hypothetical protein
METIPFTLYFEEVTPPKYILQGIAWMKRHGRPQTKRTSSRTSK